MAIDTSHYMTRRLMDRIPVAIREDTIERLLGEPKYKLVKKSNEYNFRCPYCGDSKKFAEKRRGYIYTKDWGFFCHNCGKSSDFMSFVKFMDEELYNKLFRMGYNQEKLDQSQINDHQRGRGYENNYVEIANPEKVEWRDGFLTPFNDAPERLPARQQMIKRKIRPEVTAGWFICSGDEKYRNEDEEHHAIGDWRFRNRVIIPYYRLGGDWIQFDARSPFQNTHVRYLNNKGAKREVYNIDFVDTSRTYFITEGSIDSTFLRNSVSCGGTEHFAKLIAENPKFADTKQNAVVVWDNDAAGMHSIRKWANDGWRWFDWRGFHRIDGGVPKDINDAVISGHFPLDSDGYVLESVFDGRILDRKTCEPRLYRIDFKDDHRKATFEDYVCLEDRYKNTMDKIFKENAKFNMTKGRHGN